MCGIAGFVSSSAALNVDRQSQLHAMTASLQHRGPDDEGAYHDEMASLGQTRLSIVGLSTGHQPILSTDGNLVLVANGEIYNSPTLREEYANEGYEFQTNTDVEVILPLYQKYGRDCAKYLRGMFAFAIWDKQAQTLYFARDHLGQKPFFYAGGDGERTSFVFASEVKAILAANKNTDSAYQPEIETEALWHYVSMRFVPDEYTFFKGIKKLPAGTWGIVGADGDIETQRYWQLDFTNKLQGSEQDIVAQLDRKINETVDSHMLSDVPVGAFLSGGIDSSVVTSVMATQQVDPVPVFSIGVKEQFSNEIPYAKKIADQYGMEHHAKVVSANLVKLLPKMIHHLDEPADPFGVGVYLVSNLAKDHVKVVLTGDGGDEVFAGYDRFVGQQFAEYYSYIPAFIRKHLLAPLIRLVPETFKYKTVASKLKWLSDVSFFKAGERYAHSMAILRFTTEHKNALFTQSAIQSIETKDSFDKILEHFDSDAAESLIDKMLYTDLMTRIPDHILMISDRMCMAHSIENRSPFMDVDLLEFAAAIPSKLKLKNRRLKHMLKEVAANYMGPELVNRKKQGFGFPIAQWMQNELANVLRQLFMQSKFVELGLFNQAYMLQLLDEHIAGKEDHNFRLWILLNLEIWYRLYFENQSLESISEEIEGWL